MAACTFWNEVEENLHHEMGGLPSLEGAATHFMMQIPLVRVPKSTATTSSVEQDLDGNSLWMEI